MQLIKSRQHHEYATVYFPAEPVRSQTTVTKMKVIEMPPSVKEEVIDKKKTTIAFDFLGLFTTTTKKVKKTDIDNDIKKQQCVISSEMEELVEQMHAPIQLIKPDAKITATQTLHGVGKELLVEGQEVTVAPKVTQMKNTGEFIINWVLAPLIA
jgi:hypothetical protein